MDYIQQAYKGTLGMWKYLIIPILFFGLVALNSLAINLLNIDVEEIIQKEIQEKGANRFLLESMIPFVVGLAMVFFWVKYVHNQSITSLSTSRKKIDWKRVFFSFTLWAMVTLIIFCIGYFMTPENYQWNFQLDSFLVLVVISIVLIPIQTSFEEYFFRGYLMQGLGVAFKNRWIPLLVTSLIFGLLHIENPEVAKLGKLILVYYIGTGFFLGIITLMDEGIELALGFHAANNLVTALLVTADWTAFQTNSLFLDKSEPTLGYDVFIPVLIIYPLLLVLFSKKYGWSNWQQKLFGKVEKPMLNEVQ
ncbi:MAG: CPBP family intramembrane metalloprotease [Flavobacteriaceae bacterium]|nr:CPBP family intramembrane metalloprotease [Flavobacteriaceae bacterium]